MFGQAMAPAWIPLFACRDLVLELVLVIESFTRVICMRSAVKSVER